MSLNTAMNALGTAAAIKSLFGNSTGESGGKIGNFMAEIRKAGVARTNLFDVELTAPTILLGNATAPKISLFAEGAALPGRTISTIDVTRYGYGPHEKVPYSMQFNDITLQMIGDGGGEVYKFFYNWMQGIVRGDTDVLMNAFGDSAGKLPYEVEFKDKYATTITIRQYNEQGDTIFSSTLTDAFPISVPDVNLSWSDSSMMQFSVTFAYLQNKLENASRPLEPGKNGIEGLSTLQKLIKVGSAVQVIRGLQGTRGLQGVLAAGSAIKNLF
jgi:hypothetical protein